MEIVHIKCRRVCLELQRGQESLVKKRVGNYVKMKYIRDTRKFNKSKPRETKMIMEK